MRIPSVACLGQRGDDPSRDSAGREAHAVRPRVRGGYCLFVSLAWRSALTPRIDRQAVDRQFQTELSELAETMDQAGLAAAATAVRNWFVPRAGDRSYYFLGDLAPLSAADVLPGQDPMWVDAFQAARDRQAKRLWECFAAAEAGESAGGIPLLYEILHEQPAHRQARKALGLPLTSPSPAALGGPPRTAGNPQHAYGWATGQYWRLSTDHFLITTNHSAAAATELARVLEEFYVVWRQAFAEFLLSDSEIARLAQKGWPQRGTARHEVVLFRDQDEYIAYLRRWEPQVEMTRGIYRDTDRKAYFFAGAEDVAPTWRHEVAHQLFFETTRKSRSVSQSRDFWLIEAAPLYLESLQSYAGYCTLGGIDAERLQYARYRRLQESFYVPLAELARMGRVELQGDPRIRRLYSQAAGLMHFLLHGRPANDRRQTIKFLKHMYNGAAGERDFAAALSTTYAALDAGYADFLNLTDADLFALTDHIRPQQLVLGRTSVTDKGLARLGRIAEQLEWLDLTACDVGDPGVAQLPCSVRLRRLSLEGTRVTDESLRHLAGCRALEELDLSGTRVTDEGLASLSELKQLHTLWLTGTGITDAGLARLDALPALSTLQLTNTRITPQAWSEFQQRHPQVK